MKKYIILFFFAIIITTVFSQTPKLNFDKYNYFRYRLINDFVIVDTENRQGTNIPAGKLFQYGCYLSSGENPMRNISEYMILLATEYALNKKYNINMGYHAPFIGNLDPLSEIANVLRAIERLDLNAEKFFRADINNLDSLSPNFWSEVDTYIDYENDLNGFFLRSDIDGNPEHPENRKYTIDESRFITSYNNEQLKYVDYYKNGNPDKGIEYSGAFNRPGGVETNNRAVMSQDEVAWLYMGLVMIAKLVDSDRVFKDINGFDVTIREWCAQIGYRTLFALHSKEATLLTDWQIVNPVTEDGIKDENGGITVGLSWGFQIAAVILEGLSGTDYAEDNIEEILSLPLNGRQHLFRETCLLANFINSKHALFWVMGLITADLNLDNFIWIMRKINNNHSMIGGEYYPLFFSAIHEVSIEDNWKQYNNFMTYNDYKDSIVMLLNVIPECGSYYNRNKGVKSDDYWLASRTPGFNNKRGEFCDIVKTTAINPNMDYMILFNLYYLLLEDDFPIDEYWANLEYPTTQLNPPGSHENPASLTGVKFIMNKTIHSNGNLRLKASESIELLPGFETENGAIFVAEIDSDIFLPECDLNFPEGTNPCPSEKQIEYFDEHIEEASIETENIKKNDSFFTDTIENYTCYPNPAKSEFNILFNSNFKVKEISIVNFSGQFVLSEKRQSNLVKIDISNIPNGVYFLIIKSDNQIFTEKLIKI